MNESSNFVKFQTKAQESSKSPLYPGDLDGRAGEIGAVSGEVGIIAIEIHCRHFRLGYSGFQALDS